ncbi:FadR/GntR family transcriptional regulator [Ruthenibacterium sp. TH_2024_36131]
MENSLVKMKNLRSPKLYLQVYNELRNYIVQNNLKPGDKLPTEMEMCERLGVSRNVLREAIKSLEITGVVHSTPGVGIVIQEFSTDYLFNSLVYARSDDGQEMLEQLKKIRRVLELGFSGEAFESLTEEDVEKLRQLVEKMQDLAKTLRKKPEATFGVRFAEADAAFHRALYTKLDLPLLLSLIDAFWAFDKNYQKPTSGSYIQLTVEKHERIVSALEKKDYHAFYDALDFHYRVVYRPGDESEQAFEEEN